MSDSVTGNLPWRPGGIIEHCSPSVGRGPADKVPPRERFPPLSKSAFFPPSSSPPLALTSWSVSVLCFSNFSKSIACKMCRRYLNIQNGSFKIFLSIYVFPCPMSNVPISTSICLPPLSRPPHGRQVSAVFDPEARQTGEARSTQDRRGRWPWRPAPAPWDNYGP